MDIEASGFGPTSYPIEIGVVLGNGDTYCSLITPADDWTHWDEDAQNIHGISRDALFKHGRSITEVATTLNDFLKNSTVYSDCWTLDKPWLLTLFNKARISPTFSLTDIMYAMTEQGYEQLFKQKSRVFKELNVERHRATNDARVLQIAHQKITCGH